MTRFTTLLLSVLMAAAGTAYALPEIVWKTVHEKLVRLTMTDGATAEGTVLATDDNVVVLREPQGRLVTLKKENVTEARLLDSTGDLADELFFCDYDSGSTNGELGLYDKYSDNAVAREMIGAIAAKAAVVPRFVLRPGPVENAAAFTRGGDRYILYNSTLFANLKSGEKNWVVYGIIAHEVAHHLNGDPVMPGGDRRELERAADHFSGFVLGALGATLPQAQSAIMSFAVVEESETYPSKEDRLKAVRAGWELRGKKSDPGNTVSNEDIVRSLDAEQSRDKQRISDADVERVVDPPSSPPADLGRTGLPSGAPLMQCGCWGFVSPGSMKVEPACASYRATALPCQGGICYGGGLPWMIACM